MITRTEFYILIILFAGFILYIIKKEESTPYDIEKAKIETRDSILELQRDAALASAYNKDVRSDSLMKVIERQNEDLKKTHEKYIYVKEAVVRLSADSSLAWFLRAVR